MAASQLHDGRQVVSRILQVCIVHSLSSVVPVNLSAYGGGGGPGGGSGRCTCRLTRGLVEGETREMRENMAGAAGQAALVLRGWCCCTDGTARAG
jgi:hypothetical protein